MKQAEVRIPFKLQDQILGSMGSVAANLAEFSAMESDAQKKHKLMICIGECAETIFWFDIMKTDIIPSVPEQTDVADRLQKLKASLLSLYRSIERETGNGEREATV